MYDDDPVIQIFEDDPNVYIRVNNMGYRWYYYNPDRPPLGEGAMAKVYLGYDYETHQKVAIKQLFDRYANNRSVRERAKLEASLSYRHPNMIEMLGMCAFEDEEGDWHVWLVSNYVEGETIDKHIKALVDMDPNMDIVPIVANEICGVLDALDYLHSRGVIHRDIKPSNIMVAKDSTVKLMDLGIARVTGSNSYTSNGFVGTPLYASPEQILRDKTQLQATPASDIYSLGMTMYVLISGTHPFNADTDSQILINQVTRKLPMAEALNKNKRYKKLMNVIWKATDKDQNNRFQSAMEFKAAIKNAIYNEAPPPKRWLIVLLMSVLILSISVIILLLVKFL